MTATNRALKENVKLVIWDLDETLWRGTLSEGSVDLPEEHAQVIHELNCRGIINSICSKNDFDAVRRQLNAENALWDEFVFPSISWNPKGPQIVNILQSTNLRASQTLFIDDNAGNRNEAEFFAPGIQTSGPEIIAELLDSPQMRGKSDPEKNRLAQYKLLEARSSFRHGIDGSNEDFLRSSNIKVTLEESCLEPHTFERIEELIERTNQLNYTKRRLNSDELRALLSDPDRESRIVSVKDRFGDYGIVGFYSLRGHILTDFLFSCRILHMGIENWLYAMLGSPRLEVVGEVATPLDVAMNVDWINQTDIANLTPEVVPTHVIAKVLLKGACDLIIVNDFLGGSLDSEFNGITSAGQPEHRGHTEIIRRSFPEIVSTYGAVIDQLPFLDRASYETKVFTSSSYQFLVLSLLPDYSQGLYRLRGTDFVVPYGFYNDDITDLDLLKSHPERLTWLRLTPQFVEWFAENFEFMGGASPESLQENIRWLSHNIAPGARLILLNTHEIPAFDIEFERNRHTRYREMNTAVDDVVKELANVTLLDVRELITSRDDFTDSVVRYRRRVYLGIARRLQEIVDADIDVKRISRASLQSSAIGLSRSLKKSLPPGVLRTLGKVKFSVQSRFRI